MTDSVNHGERGLLAVDLDASRIQCHVCGRWMRNLAQHARLPSGH